MNWLKHVYILCFNVFFVVHDRLTCFAHHYADFGSQPRPQPGLPQTAIMAIFTQSRMRHANMETIKSYSGPGFVSFEVRSYCMISLNGLPTYESCS